MTVDPEDRERRIIRRPTGKPVVSHGPTNGHARGWRNVRGDNVFRDKGIAPARAKELWKRYDRLTKEQD